MFATRSSKFLFQLGEQAVVAGGCEDPMLAVLAGVGDRLGNGKHHLVSATLTTRSATLAGTGTLGTS